MADVWDKTKHSQGKLGMVGSSPVLPMLPTAAQVRLGPMGPTVHYRLMGDSYVNGQPPSIPPAQVKAVVQALKAALADPARMEPSYSGTGTPYVKLDVTPDPSGSFASLSLGAVSLGRVYVDPTTEIVSGDEPLMDQINGGGGDDNG